MTGSVFTADSWLARCKPSRIVVFRALQLGDMLCAVPALRALRAALPQAHIALTGLPWAQQFADRFVRYVDEFIAFPGHPDFPEQTVQHHLLPDYYAAMRARRVDLAIQLHGSGPQSNTITRAFAARSCAGFGDPLDGVHERFVPFPEHGPEPERLLSLLDALGVQHDGADLEFPIMPSDLHELAHSEAGRKLPAGPYVCFHPGARWRDKCWHPARFARVADALARECGVAVVLTGSAAEADLTSAVARHMKMPSIDTASALSIGAMAAIISRARLIVGNDTGVSHVAAGLRVPSVIIFSKADIGRWAPCDRARHRCLWDPDGERVSEVLEHARELLSR